MSAVRVVQSVLASALYRPHCHEQGGAEYNLALGQKRADAVVKVLKVFGVKDGQMEAVSFGKEKPKASGENDAAWTENRRADIVYSAK